MVPVEEPVCRKGPGEGPDSAACHAPVTQRSKIAFASEAEQTRKTRTSGSPFGPPGWQRACRARGTGVPSRACIGWSGTFARCNRESEAGRDDDSQECRDGTVAAQRLPEVARRVVGDDLGRWCDRAALPVRLAAREPAGIRRRRRDRPLARPAPAVRPGLAADRDLPGAAHRRRPLYVFRSTPGFLAARCAGARTQPL